MIKVVLLFLAMPIFILMILLLLIKHFLNLLNISSRILLLTMAILLMGVALVVFLASVGIKNLVYKRSLRLINSTWARLKR